METQILKLELTVAEINVILRSLGKHPFDEIADLISKIRGQGETQLEQMLDESEKASAQADSTRGGNDEDLKRQ